MTHPIFDQIYELNAQMRLARVALDLYVRDTAIPLVDRWQAFTAAPAAVRGYGTRVSEELIKAAEARPDNVLKERILDANYV